MLSNILDDLDDTNFVCQSQNEPKKRVRKLKEKWTSEQIASLIQEVEAREGTWNFLSREYRDRNLREALWQEVAAVLKMPRSEVATKWNSLRCSFRAMFNKMGQTKSGQAAGKTTPTNPLYNSLKFLEPTLQIEAPTTSNFANIHDDLEKDHDFSGSGFGPDDEDSDSDYRHHSHKHQTGKSNINKNIDDNDFITTSRNNNQNNQNQNIHQISSSNSGINNQGNTGIISSGGSSATSGNTGLNTIDNANNNNNNNNQQNQGKNVLPTTINTSQHHHATNTDDDDFDIEEEEEGGILAGSGDGGLIDHDTDDDDHTGDVDADGGDNDGSDLLPDITKYQHGIYNGATGNGKAEHKPINTNDDFEEEEDFDHHQPIDRDDEDDNEEEEEDKTHNTHSEDNTEIYTDITDETTKTGTSSSSSSTTTDKRPGGINSQGGTNIHDLDTNSINSLPPETKIIEQTTGNEVSIMNANDDDRTASFFAQPGILAAVIGGAVVGLLCAILVVMFIVYRMRKKDEGSYALDEPKRSPAMNSYAKNATNREFYA